MISLPTGTKIFNWLSTYLGNPPLLLLKTNSPFFGLLFLLMFTIGGSTGIILGNAAVDLGLHDYYFIREKIENFQQVCKSKNFGSWVYQLMIQFIVVSSFFLQDYISFIFLLVFFFVVFSFGLVLVLIFNL